MKQISSMAATTEPRDTLLSRIPVFDGMDEASKAALRRMMEPMVVPKYQFIYHQGDPAGHLYLLEHGVVKIGTFNSDGREIIKQILHPEALFGEMSVICEERHDNYALTFNSEVYLYRIDAEDFRTFLQQCPGLYFNILAMIGRKLKHTEKRLESLIFKDARERIVDFLKQNAEKHGMRVGYETMFKHSFTQQDIANFTGTSRQTVTSVLNDLRKSNMIYFNRKSVLIRDMESLR
jgi:CRP-like cAMP-binding protein